MVVDVAHSSFKLQLFCCSCIKPSVNRSDINNNMNQTNINPFNLLYLSSPSLLQSAMIKLSKGDEEERSVNTFSQSSSASASASSNQHSHASSASLAPSGLLKKPQVQDIASFDQFRTTLSVFTDSYLENGQGLFNVYDGGELKEDIDDNASEQLHETKPRKQKEKQSMSGGLSCQMCLKGEGEFADVNEQREHFRSDWHKLNLKRVAKGSQPLSFDQVQKLFNDETGEIESISASSSSGSDNESENEAQGYTSYKNDSDDEENDMLQKSGQGRNPHKMYVTFGLKNPRGDGSLRCKIHGSVVCNMKELKELEANKVKFTWLVLMFGGGHFAGAVYRNGALGAEHKTFHRYTVRRKQGGSQSTQDATGRKPKSVGSTLRRLNEKMLEEDVHELIKSWKGIINNECDRIFIACPHRMRHVLFQEPQALESHDPRIRYIPFTTGRPTLKEATRVVTLLSTVWIFQETKLSKIDVTENHRQQEQQQQQKKNNVDENLAKDTENLKLHQISLQASVSTESEISDFDDMERLAQKIFKEREIHRLVQSEENYEKLKSLIEKLKEKNPTDIDAQNENGECALFIAAKKSNITMIHLLLESGASPFVRDFRNRLPFQGCTTKASKNAFREFRGSHPDMWDYDTAMIPAGITEESEKERKEKEKEKKRQQQLAMKEKLAQEEKELAELEEKKRKEEEEAEKFRQSNEPKCSMCKGRMPAKKKDWFTMFEYQYCSSACQQKHRRMLAAEAAEKRLGSASKGM